MHLVIALSVLVTSLLTFQIAVSADPAMALHSGMAMVKSFCMCTI